MKFDTISSLASALHAMRRAGCPTDLPIIHVEISRETGKRIIEAAANAGHRIAPEDERAFTYRGVRFVMQSAAESKPNAQ